jgi:type 1 glutamine amidotransferase/HEAT repeat protein
VTLSTKKTVLVQFALAAFLTASAAAAPPIRVLFITGRNNHKWKLTTPSITKSLKDSGRFKVDITEKPSEITAKSLEGYDVILNGWTGFPKKTGHLWGLDTEKAIDDFVASGKGMISFHAGSSSFHDWDGFQKIIGATWGKGTGHGRYHEFTVDMTDIDHPITKGMKSFKTSDELWHRVAVLQPTPGRKVLCTAMSAESNRGTGKNEPIAICTTFGKGRGFYTSLGHDVKALENPGCKLLMLRGIEWAATGKVTIGSDGQTDAPATADVDSLLAATTTYKYPDDRTALKAVAEYIQQAAGNAKSRQAVAAKLAAMLKSKATTDCKKFVCDQLSLVGSAAEVPALTALLEDGELALDARSALLRIPGAESLAAMRKLLASSKPTIAAGLIATLGARRDANSIDAISSHLGPKGPAAEAAVDALGSIGGAKALALLTKADSTVSSELKLVLNDAILKCADDLAEAGKIDEAADAYKMLSEPDRPRHVRVAAFPGVIAAQKSKAAPLLLSALTGKDRTMQSAAIRCLSTFKGKEITQAVADKLSTLPPESQAQVIGILARRQDDTALPAISALASSKNDEVRQAALAGMGQLGGASTVKPLVAAMGAAADRPTIQQSLARLKGDGVDKALIANLTAEEPGVRIGIIEVLSDRNARSAADTLLKTASKDTDPAVRKAAIKSLGVLSDSKMCAKLVDLMDKTQSASERRGIVNALITITRSSPKSADKITGMLADKFKTAQTAETKSAILAVAGGIGGDGSLKIVREAAGNKDLTVRTAAVRAMSAWADAAPLEDLLTVIGSEKQLVPKTLAVRGLVELSSKAANIPADKLTAIYAKAMKLTSRSADTKTLLSGLGAIGAPEALKLALSYIDNKETVNEAALATVNIAEKLIATDTDAVRAAVAKAAGACKLKIVADKASKIRIILDKPINLARGAKASSPDGLEGDGESSGDQAAIDGDPNTYWDEANNRALYRLKIDFKRPIELSVLSIQGYAHHSYAPKDFEILCDGKSVKTVKGATYTENKLIVPFPRTACKSLELKITGCYGGSPAIRELELYNPKQTSEPKAASSSSASAAPEPAKGFSWKQTDTALSLMNGQKAVWRLNYDPKKGKPYIHPLATVDGSVLTWNRPPDHVWHRALWFSWKTINKLNYWEENRQGLSQGRTEIKSTKITLGKNYSASVEMVISYHPPQKPEVLAEKRTIVFSSPTAIGRYRIDWTSVFTATGGDVLLDRTPIKGEKGGKGWGGYAGLSIRMAKETRGWRILDSKGRQAEKIHGQPDAVWVDASGKTTGGQQAGVAMFDHPSNTRHPSPWYIAKGMPYFSPALLYNKPLTLKKAESLTLKYRVLVHPGPADKKMLDEEFKTFAKN